MTEIDVGFISTRDMFWLASVDQTDAPTVSYKGGAPGFVRAVDSRTLVFPCCDGNRMFYSMGNIAIHPQVGLLFMDFERPHRLRVQGTATIETTAGGSAAFPGALFIVRVAITSIFQNCPRYVHPQARVGTSRYVPAQDGSAPLAGWKRSDFIQPALPHDDQGRPDARAGRWRLRHGWARWSAAIRRHEPRGPGPGSPPAVMDVPLDRRRGTVPAGGAHSGPGRHIFHG